MNKLGYSLAVAAVAVAASCAQAQPLVATL